MNETELQIVISVINDAADQLSEVATQLGSLGEQTATAAAEMSDSMAAAGTSMEDSASAAEAALADAAVAATSSWTSAMDDVSESAAAVPASITNSWSSLSNVSADTAAQVQEQWGAASSAAEADLADMLSQSEADFTGMAESASAAGSVMESSISSVGGKMQMVGIQLGLLGASIAAPAALAVTAAGDQVDAFDQLSNTIKNVYASATTPAAGLSTEIADLTAKINAQKATIAEGDAAMQKWTGTTAEVAASHDKAAASVATAQVNIQKLQQQLDELTNSQQLAGGSASATTAQFEAAAKSATSLGFNVSDSAQALQFLFASTNSVPQTLSAFQDAMDLSAAKGIDLTTASNDVIQATQGMGRSLRDLGVNVSDGLSGQTALDAIQQKVAGSAQLAATQGLGPYTVATAQLNEAMATFGATVLPMLATFLEDASDIITKVNAWAEAHPKLAEALVIFSALLGGILIVLGAILVPLGLLIISIEALNTAVDALGVTMLAGIGFALLYVAAFVAFVAIVALVIVYHKQIMDAIEAAWNWIIGFVTQAWEAIVAILFPGMGSLVVFLFNNWSTIKTDVEDAWNWIENFISGIWTKIVSDAEAALTTVQNLINKLMAPITAVTSAVSSITSGVGNVLGSSIKAFASGGIVNSPTLALVGEAGPEAIIPLSAFSGGSSLSGAGGGAAGNIVININGGSYLNQGGAQQIAQALATMIGQQLKLKIR